MTKPQKMETDQTACFLSNPMAMYRKGFANGARLFKLQVFGCENYFLCDPNESRRVLRNIDNQFSAGDGNFDISSDLFGNSLLYMDAPDHEVTRRVYSKIFDSITDHEIERVSKNALNFNSALETNEITISKVKDTVFWSVCELALGASPIDMSITRRQIDILSSGLYSNPQDVSRDPLFTEAMHQRALLKDKILERLYASKPGPEQKLSILALFQTPEGFGQRGTFIVDQILTILFAGYDTTASSISWLLWEASQNTQLRKTLDDLHVKFSVEGRISPMYCDAVTSLFWEIQRIYPSVYFIPRMLLSDQIVLGHSVPKGSIVNVVPYFAHRLDPNFPNPERFDPNRFLGERSRTARSSILGFGYGPKYCVGARIAEKMFLHLVVALNFYTYSRQTGEAEGSHESWVPVWGLRDEVKFSLSKRNIGRE